MGKVHWHSGPPPSIGWWPADLCGQLDVVRWWDGKRWSISFRKDNQGVYGMKYAAQHPSPYDNSKIKWRLRPSSWPKRSRT